MHVRAGTETDAGEVARIQAASPEAAQWAADGYPLLVAEAAGHVAGFVIWRETAPDEAEILNLAVDPPYRRRGAARALLFAVPRPNIFLEVRESNHAARSLYIATGFVPAGVRCGYYQHPPETAVVMRWQK